MGEVLNIEIPEIEVRSMEVTLIGDSPLIVHKLRLFKRKYETLSELAEVFMAIDKVVRS